MAYQFFVGIDLEEESPTVAVSLLEKRANADGDDVEYHLDRLQRMKRSEDVVEKLKDLLTESQYVGRSVCVVNATSGEGIELQRQLTEGGLSPLGVAITGADTSSQEGSGFDLEGGGDAGADEGALIVSEHELVQNLIDHETEGSLSFAESQAGLASDLGQGLQKYRTTAHEAGAALSSIDVSPSRDAEHADLVLSTALACWMGDQHEFDPTEHLGGELPTTGQAKRIQRPDTN